VGGRHQRGGRRRGPRSRYVLIGALALVLLATVALVVLILRHDKTDVVAARHKPTCTAGVALTVVADPSVATVIGDIADGWSAARPIIDGACPTVTVRSQPSAIAASAFARPDTTLPDVWIPNSTLWVNNLRSATAGADTAANSIWISPPIATSPLVVATMPSQADSVRRAVAGGWRAVFADPAALTTDDPSRNTDGLVGLLMASAALNGSADTPTRDLVDSFVTMSRSVVPSAAAGLQALVTKQRNGGRVIASEQQVRQAAGGPSGSAKVTAVYPPGAVLGLDWPVAMFTPPGGDPARRDAASAFAAQLTQPDAQRRLRASGLRDRAGTAHGGAPSTKHLPIPSVAHVSDALRAWTAAGRSSRTLIVIDLSGSMAATIGGGQTKIQFAAAAERAAIDFLPDTSALGLWGFSVDRTPSTDWKQFVSVGPLDGKLGATTRRQALIAVSQTLPTSTGGDTGLYPTALAAYKAVRSGYDPASVNSVVLLTDGANTDTRGIDLATLLSTLRSETNANRPLPIITIAVGADADAATLRKISAATGGTEYTVAKPQDIRDVFLDAVIRAG
jgi:Ca-activated chloride channel family protein